MTVVCVMLRSEVFQRETLLLFYDSKKVGFCVCPLHAVNVG